MYLLYDDENSVYIIKKKKMKIRKNYYLVISLLVIIGVLLVKSWDFWQEPRLWAEEGTVYLKASLEESWRSALSSQLGYYAIIPSVTIYFSTFSPLQYLPYITQGASLLFWILLFGLIAGINKKEYSAGVKIVYLFSVLFILLSQPEVFLNTINLQFITPLILLVSLLYDEKKLTKIQIMGFRILQVICILNGVLSLLLMPYLLYRAVLKDKKYGLAILYIFLGLLHVYFVLNYSGQSDLMWRVNGNLEYLIQDFERSILRVIANRKIYVILVGLVLLIIGILYAEGRKEGRKEGRGGRVSHFDRKLVFDCFIYRFYKIAKAYYS